MNLIQLYLREEADKQQKLALSQWISESEDNYHLFQQLKNLWEAEHPEFSESSVENLKRREQNNLLSRRRTLPRTIFTYWSRISAVLIIPLAILLSLVLSQSDATDSSVKQSVSCAYGGVVNFTLPDGSIVHLNSGSTISFPSEFKNGKRTVELKGEAFFEVLSDKEHPFVVQTDGMNVIATGTRFNVDAYPGFTSRVTLVSGILDIEKGISRYSLPQGYQLDCTPDGNVSSFRTDTFKWTSWKDGVIAFRGDKLSYVFERLSLIYNAKIIIEDPEIADLQIRATFREERLDEIMGLLEKCAPIICERRDPRFSDRMEYHLFLQKK